MPGPGGGSRGGGGGRGGSFGGGGFHGGQRPGGFHGGPRPMGGWHMGGWYPRRRYFGGGCLGGLMGIAMIPVIVILFMVFSIFSIFSGGMDVVINNGYDEETFQNFANSQYREEFGSSTAYEDNLLIVFLIDEDYYSFSYIAWVGDHIAMDINHMLGAEGTALGNAMNQCINASNYKYSLDTDLAFVVEKLTDAIGKAGLEDAFSCDEDHIQVSSHLTNMTQLEMNEAAVNTALEAFTQATGIPAVIVVEDMTDVFGAATRVGTEYSWGFLAVIGVTVVVIILLVKRRKGRDDGFGDAQKDSRYRQFDDQY